MAGSGLSFDDRGEHELKGIEGSAASLRPAEQRADAARILGPVLRAVLLDVDFTLFRPGPELGPQGYVRSGRATG